jgi:hypothetical protein
MEYFGYEKRFFKIRNIKLSMINIIRVINYYFYNIENN